MRRRGLRQLSKRSFTLATPVHSKDGSNGGLGVVLDIDGVLLRGKQVIKNAPEALKLLQKNKIPYVFVTNGGGMLEKTKAKDLTSKLGLKQAVLEEDVLLSHSPFKELASLYFDKRVLILGHAGCIEVARSYGFRKIVSAEQLHLENPSIYHREVQASVRQSDHAKEPVHAALIFHDPLHWALEIQVLTDLLRPKVPGGPQTIPLYACNPDLVYNTEHKLPRFTQGAFCEAFRVVYEQHTDEELLINYCGKPFSVQYRFARSMLENVAKRLQVPAPKTFVGIGDNPLSDIKGAKLAGSEWRSILVRTGVWQSSELNDASHPADHVCADVLEAVEFALSTFANRGKVK